MVTAKLVLWTYHNPTKKGYPIKVLVTKNRKTKPYNLKLYSSLEDWNTEAMEPKKSHPRYLFVRKQVRKIKGRIEELLEDAYDKRWSKEQFIEALDGAEQSKKSSPKFFEFGDKRVQELKDSGRNGTAKMYASCLSILRAYNLGQDISIEDVNYTFLNNFKLAELNKGTSPNSLGTYLKIYRAIFNEAIHRSLVTKENYPFSRGLIPKKTKTPKRNISKADIKKLEDATNLSGNRLHARNYYLLMFYFGGMDLIDISNLTKDHLSKNRIKYFRTKLENGGNEIDLKVFKKAKKIIDFYSVNNSKYLFPITSSLENYDEYYRQYNAIKYHLNKLGQELGIELKLTSKTARHSFSTIGKRLYTDPEMLKELMGHEGNEVADVYKDRFPQADRDKAHWKIIET